MFLWVFHVFFSLTVSSICVFPPEFVGEYLIQRSLSYVGQNSNNNQINAMPLINSDEVIQYSSINITADLIFPFGQCIARNNSNYIVVLRCDHKSPQKQQKMKFCLPILQSWGECMLSMLQLAARIKKYHSTHSYWDRHQSQMFIIAWKCPMSWGNHIKWWDERAEKRFSLHRFV